MTDKSDWAQDIKGRNILSSGPGFLFRRLHQIAVALFMQETMSLDTTPVQHGVLSMVDKNPGIDQASTALAIGVDQTTIVGVVDRLERKGLLSRTVSAVDRRARALTVTAAGRDLLEKVAAPAAVVDQRITEYLSPVERSFLFERINNLLAHHEQSGLFEDVAQD